MTCIRLIVPLGKEGDADMLGLLALVLIVLWLLGFLAFHVSAGMIHILLVVGIVLLFQQGRYQNSIGWSPGPHRGMPALLGTSSIFVSVVEGMVWA